MSSPKTIAQKRGKVEHVPKYVGSIQILQMSGLTSDIESSRKTSHHFSTMEPQPPTTALPKVRDETNKVEKTDITSKVDVDLVPKSPIIASPRVVHASGLSLDLESSAGSNFQAWPERTHSYFFSKTNPALALTKVPEANCDGKETRKQENYSMEAQKTERCSKNVHVIHVTNNNFTPTGHSFHTLSTGSEPIDRSFKSKQPRCKRKRGLCAVLFAVCALVVLIYLGEELSSNHTKSQKEMYTNYLLNIFENTGGEYSWIVSSGWNSNADICLWYGITCENNEVREIDLSSNNLIGDIAIVSKAMMEIKTLHILNFYNNSLYGDVSVASAQLSELIHLRSLDVRLNPNINGSVSSDLCNLLYIEEGDISADCLISCECCAQQFYCECVDVYEWVDVLGNTCQWYVIKF